MNDILLQLGQNPQARRLVKTLGLPLPMPQTLSREKAPMQERPLHDYEIVVGGHSNPDDNTDSPIIEVLAKTLTKAGATPLVTGGAHLPEAFLAQGEAWGRPPRGLMLDALPDKLRFDGMVFDATAIQA